MRQAMDFRNSDDVLSKTLCRSTTTARTKIEKIVIAGLNYVPEKATIESIDGKTTDLKIVSMEGETFDSFIIKTVSVAIQNLLCGGLLAAMLVIHAAKNLMN
jgi:hypothetical protein